MSGARRRNLRPLSSRYIILRGGGDRLDGGQCRDTADVAQMGIAVNTAASARLCRHCLTQYTCVHYRPARSSVKFLLHQGEGQDEGGVKIYTTLNSTGSTPGGTVMTRTP